MRGLDREEATGLREHIDGSITNATVLLPDGTVDRDYIQVKSDWKRLLDAIAITGRGIYYHEKNDIVPLNVSEKPVVAESDKVVPTFKNNTEHVRSFASGSFKYISVRGEEEPHRCGYFLNFFNRLFFSVVFYDEKRSWLAV
jgi:hypothetical protein